MISTRSITNKQLYAGLIGFAFVLLIAFYMDEFLNIPIKYALQDNPQLVLDVLEDHPELVIEIIERAREEIQQKNLAEAAAELRIEELKNPKTFYIAPSRAAKPGSNPNAPLSLVVFSSFLCPNSAVGSKIIDQLMEKYPNQLNIHYKHATADTLDFQLGLLFEAVSLQDKQKAWQLHDYLFENMSATRRGGVNSVMPYLASLELNLEQLQQDMLSQPVRDALRTDRDEGVSYKVSKTPTFYINGVSITGTQASIEEFSDLIDLMLIRQVKQKND